MTEIQPNRATPPVLRDAASNSPSTPLEHAALRAATEALEANFLAEMLKHAGVGKSPSAFGGGAGEEAFSSLLVRAQAEHMAANGSVGIAERLFEAMIRADGNGADAGPKGSET